MEEITNFDKVMQGIKDYRMSISKQASVVGFAKPEDKDKWVVDLPPREQTPRNISDDWLLKVCSKLTAKQMQMLKKTDCALNLFDWYLARLIYDYKYSGDVIPSEMILKELRRLAPDISPIDHEYQTDKGFNAKILKLIETNHLA